MRIALVLLFGCALCGCGSSRDPSPGADGSVHVDAGTGSDGGDPGVDGGMPGTDAGPPGDGGAIDVDAGLAADAGIPEEGVNCDQRDVLCRALPPECPEWQVPRVEGSCWAGCVPIDACACAGPDDCPMRDIYTCHNSAGRCGPYL